MVGRANNSTSRRGLWRRQRAAGGAGGTGWWNAITFLRDSSLLDDMLQAYGASVTNTAAFVVWSARLLPNVAMVITLPPPPQHTRTHAHTHLTHAPHAHTPPGFRATLLPHLHRILLRTFIPHTSHGLAATRTRTATAHTFDLLPLLPHHCARLLLLPPPLPRMTRGVCGISLRTRVSRRPLFYQLPRLPPPLPHGLPNVCYSDYTGWRIHKRHT